MNAPWIKRPSPAFVVAMIALFVGLTGTAGAVATQVVPLAKRALVAENAKKLGGRRRRRSAAEQYSRPFSRPRRLPGRPAPRRGWWSSSPRRARSQPAEGHRSRSCATPGRRSSAEDSPRTRSSSVSTRTRPATRRGACSSSTAATPLLRASVPTQPASGRGRAGMAAGVLRSAPAAAFSDQAASLRRPARRRHRAAARSPRRRSPSTSSRRRRRTAGRRPSARASAPPPGSRAGPPVC